MKRIEAVERDLKALAQASASKDDNNRIRAEVKRLYDSLHVGEQTSIFCIDPNV